jgi:hypothetical protein
MQACTESSYHEFRKEQLSLRTGSAAFVEAKDASTHTEGTSVMPPELAQKGPFGPVLMQKYAKGAFPDVSLAQKTDSATAANVSAPGLLQPLSAQGRIIPTHSEHVVLFRR